MTRDWRLEQLETQPFLREVDFVRKPYRPYRPDWDHDHCAACWTKLAEPGFEDGDVVHEGYATTDAFVRGADYEWVCVPCFQLFQREMCWSDMTDRSPRARQSSAFDSSLRSRYVPSIQTESGEKR